MFGTHSTALTVSLLIGLFSLGGRAQAAIAEVRDEAHFSPPPAFATLPWCSANACAPRRCYNHLPLMRVSAQEGEVGLCLLLEFVAQRDPGHTRRQRDALQHAGRIRRTEGALGG